MPAFYNIKFNSIANNTKIPPSLDLPFLDTSSHLNCKANNYSSSCMQWSTTKGKFLIRRQSRQTLRSTIPCWTVYFNQVSCSVSCCCAIDDEDASATSSCSCLAGNFCLHSYSVVHIPASKWQTPAKLCNTRNNARHDISSGMRILSACNGTQPPHSAISTC